MKAIITSLAVATIACLSACNNKVNVLRWR